MRPFQNGSSSSEILKSINRLSQESFHVMIYVERARVIER